MTEEEKLQQLEKDLKRLDEIKKRLSEIRDQREIHKVKKQIDDSNSS